jgi:hypothetical protein
MKHAIFILAFAFATFANAYEQRDSSQRAMFIARYPCPSNGPGTCYQKGYIVDHIRPIACGGPDVWRNMQWQTIADSKRKDAIELDGCKK